MKLMIEYVVQAIEGDIKTVKRRRKEKRQTLFLEMKKITINEWQYRGKTLTLIKKHKQTNKNKHIFERKRITNDHSFYSENNATRAPNRTQRHCLNLKNNEDKILNGNRTNAKNSCWSDVTCCMSHQHRLNYLSQPYRTVITTLWRGQ